MAKSAERMIAEALDQEIRGHQFGPTRLADLMGVNASTVHRWCSGELHLSCSEFLGVVRAISTREPERALRLADRVLGLIGLTAFHAPTPPGPTTGDAILEAADVPEAAVDYARTVRNAVADGFVSASEDAQIATAQARLMREAAESRSVVQAMGSPEASLPMTRGSE